MDKNVKIRLLADVTNLKSGFSGSGKAVQRLSKRLLELTKGTIKLTKAGRLYDTQSKSFISKAEAQSRVTKALAKEEQNLATAKATLESITNSSTAATEKEAVVKKTSAQVSREQTTAMMSSGSATDRLTASIVALSKGEYILTAQGTILNAETKEEATLKDVASAATNRLAKENEELRVSYANVTQGMSTGQKTLLDNQMAMGGMAHATGSASFAVVSLGQVFQDMGQFGIGAAQGVRAITNNVQQTAQAFVMLSAQTGGATKGLKAMLGMLKGPVGFLAVFSLITGAIELVSNRMQMAKKDAREMGEAFNDALTIVGEDPGGLKGILVTSEDAFQSVGRLSFLLDDIKARREELLAQYGGGEINKENFLQQENALKTQKGILETAKDILEVRLGITDTAKGELEALEAAFTIEERRLGAIAEADRIRAEELSGIALDNEFALSIDLPDDEIDFEPLETFATIFSETMFNAKQDVGQLRENLSRLKGSEGLRLAEMEEQTKELEKQIEYQKLLNRMKVLGLDQIGPVRFAKEDFAPTEDVISSEDRKKQAEDMKKMRLQVSSNLKGLVADGKAYTDAQNRIIDANEKFRQSMATLGTDLITAFASIGGGLDGMQKVFGSFLIKYGKSAVKIGLLVALQGVAIQKAREALTTFKAGNSVAAGLAFAAAGAAAIAIGSRLRATARDSARSLGGGGGGGGRALFGSPNADYGFRTNNASSISVGTRTPAVLQYEFVASGRNLVGVLATESASNARVVGNGYAGGAKSGYGFSRSDMFSNPLVDMTP